MGDYNQYLWIQKHASLIEEPILEIGSKFYDPKTSMDYRGLLSGRKYVGVDMSPGANVDVVVDFSGDFASIEGILGTRFKTIICCSVMEHVKDIYSFAANVSKILTPGGRLFLSVPFTWEFHGYPNDYWRFTPAAIEFLYPQLDFSAHERGVSSAIDYEYMNMAKPEDLNLFIQKENVWSEFEKKNKGGLRLLKKAINLIRYRSYRKEYVIRKLLGREYRLSLSCINMIGKKT